MNESYNYNFSGYYPFINELSDIYLPDINKKKGINKKNILKYNYRLTISIIILIICAAGHIMNQKGLFDITDPSKINKLNEKSDNEFNITKFLISNDTCENYDLISSNKIHKYFLDITEFKSFKKLNNYLTCISFILSISILSIIFCINRCYIKEQKENKYLKMISLALGCLLLLNEFLIFIFYINLFMRLYDVINFIEKNINNKCIILLTWDYTLKVLKQLIRIIIIFALLKICNIQLIIYFIKKLIVLNNFFNYEEKERNKDIHLSCINNEENENDKEDIT